MVERKEIKNWEVFTPDGWSDFTGIQKLEKEKYVNITFSNKKHITCSLNHKLKNENDEFVYAKDICFGDELHLDQFKERVFVENIELIENDIVLHDLLNVKKRNQYYVNNIVSSNCAFIRDMPEIWTSILPTITVGGRVVMISTPDGTSNIFHDVSMSAQRGENDFYYREIPWQEIPVEILAERVNIPRLLKDYNKKFGEKLKGKVVDDIKQEISTNKKLSEFIQQKWKEKEIRSFGATRFKQEYECSFNARTNTFLNQDVMQYIESTILYPISDYEYSSKLKVWERPIDGEEYAIGCDVSSGNGTDYSAIQVIRSSTNEQVAEYCAKIDTSIFAQIICEIGEKYNNAIVAIERNNLGHSVITKIRDDFPYPRFLFLDSNGRPVISNTYDGFHTPGIKAGFTMQQQSRQNVLNLLLESLENKRYTLRSKDLHEEFKTLIWRGGRVDHQKNKNDDLIIALAIAMWTREMCMKTITSGIEMQETFIKHFYHDSISFNSSDTEHNVGRRDTYREQFSSGIYSPYGPMIQTPKNKSLEHSVSKYDRGNGRVVRKKVSDPFGDDSF